MNAIPTPAEATLGGVWTPTLTPLTTSGDIDSQRLVAHAQWCLERGCHGVGLFGTTGEANSFTVAERRAALEALVAGGIDPRRVMVGTGCCAGPDTVELTRHAVDLGCAGVLMLPPFYYKGVSDAGLLRSYTEVIEAVDDSRLRVCLYHFPRLSGVPLGVELVAELATRFPGTVTAIKDSSGDWSNTAALIEGCPSLAVFPGSETFLHAALKAGGVGCITATANVNAAAIRGVYDAWVSDDGRAERRQAGVSRARATLDARPLVPALKALIGHYREDPAWRKVRAPMIEFDDAATQTLVSELEGQRFEYGGRIED